MVTVESNEEHLLNTLQTRNLVEESPGLAHETISCAPCPAILSIKMYQLIGLRKSPPPQIVNLLFATTNQNIELTILRRVDLLKLINKYIL